MAGVERHADRQPIPGRDFGRRDRGGGLLDATYARANTDPAIANLFWIQLVTTNRPLGGGGMNGYIDPLPNDDALPFYWTIPEDGANDAVNGRCGQFVQGNKTATTYHYYDCSQRRVPSGSPNTTWSGELLLASWTNPGGNWTNAAPPMANQRVVTLYDGITWGWTLSDPADAIPDAIPEPGTWALLVCGFAGLGALQMRSTRAARAA